MDDEKVLKTGTTTVGIKCKEGIILAADKRATAGNMIVDKKAKKVHIINERMALTTAGTVSDIQLLTKLVKAESKLKSMRTGRDTNVREAANLLSGMVYSNIRKLSTIPGVSHFLFGGADQHGLRLYDIFADGSLTEVDDFVASGSGSVFAYGVLEANYTEDLDPEKAVNLAVQAVNAALQRDSASGEGIDVVKITPDGAEHVKTEQLDMKLTV